MTKNQKTKLASQVVTFIIIFSMLLTFIPYVAVLLSAYYAFQLARRV